MICQVSYKAVKSFRQGKQAFASQGAKGLDPDAKGLPGANGYPKATEAFGEFGVCMRANGFARDRILWRPRL